MDVIRSRLKPSGAESAQATPYRFFHVWKSNKLRRMLEAAWANRVLACTDKVAIRYRNASLMFLGLTLLAAGASVDGFELKFTHFSVWCVGLFGAFILCIFSALKVQGRADLRAYRARHGFCLRCGQDLRGRKRRCPKCKAVIKPLNNYPEVVRFFQVYFWRGWHEEATDYIEVLNHALERETELQIFQITTQLAALLFQGYSEEELIYLMKKDFHCFFDPAAVGMNRAEWMGFVQHTLAEKYARSG